MTSMPTLNIFLSPGIILRLPSRITSLNFGDFKEKYLWENSVIVEPLSLVVQDFILLYLCLFIASAKILEH